MKLKAKTNSPTPKQRSTLRTTRTFCLGLALLVGVAGMSGCGTSKPKGASRDFFTSGSREADERASQTMARHEQLTGEGEGSTQKGVKKAEANRPENLAAGATNKAAQATGKLALFDRLGGEAGVSNIVADFMPRALQDPRVNWQRAGVKKGGLSFHRGKTMEWKPTPESVAQLQKHLVDFICLATGGPAHYEGRELRSTHAGMHIDNAQFDAAIGDLKASLDRLQIPNKEQKELLAIIESTRPEIVQER